jgi:hypothetical protein
MRTASRRPPLPPQRPERRPAYERERGEVRTGRGWLVDRLVAAVLNDKRDTALEFATTLLAAPTPEEKQP